MLKHSSLAAVIAAATVAAGFAGSAAAKVEGDTIILGSALSETGRNPAAGTSARVWRA